MPRRTATVLALVLLGALGLAVALDWQPALPETPAPAAPDEVVRREPSPRVTGVERLQREVVQGEQPALEAPPAEQFVLVAAPFSSPGTPEPAAAGEPLQVETEPVRVVVRVSTPGGQPLAGARVELLQTPKGVAVGPEVAAVEARFRAFRNHAGVPVQEDEQFTGRDGLATLEVQNPDGALHLRAHHAHFDRAVRTLDTEPTSGRIYDLFLRDGATVEAWIYGDLPAPFEGNSAHRVVYLHKGSASSPRARRSARIEEVGAGRFRAILRGVPAGTWQAQVTVMKTIRGGRGWEPVVRAAEPLTVVPGGHAHLEFVVPAGSSSLAKCSF